MRYTDTIMKPSEIRIVTAEEIQTVRLAPGMFVTVYLHSGVPFKDEEQRVVQVELRVTPSGKFEIFHDEGVSIEPFTEWYHIHSIDQ